MFCHPITRFINLPPVRFSVFCLLIKLLFVSNISAQQAIDIVLPEGHTAGITDLNYSPDGKYIVSASRDGTARVWSAGTARLKYTLKSGSGLLTSASYSPDGKKIITTYLNGVPAVWDAETGKKITNLEEQRLVSDYNKASFNNNGSRIVTPHYSSYKAMVWDSETGKMIYTIDENRYVFRAQSYCAACHAFYSHNGNFIITSSEENSIAIWDAKTRQQVRTISSGGTVYDLQTDKTDKYIIASSLDSSCRIWDMKSGEPILVFKETDTDIMDVKFSPDTKYAAIALSDSTLVIWDIPNKKKVKTIRSRHGIIRQIVFSPEGLRFATADSRNMVSLWDIEHWAYINEVEFPGGVSCIQFSPDGNEMAVASYAAVTVLNTFNMEEINSLRTKIFQPELLAASPDGRYFVSTAHSSDYSLRVWDIAKGTLATEKSGHEKLITGADYSNDGKQLVSSSNDNTIKLWDTRSWECINTFTDCKVSLSKVKFSSTNRYIAAIGDDNALYVWDMSQSKLIMRIPADKEIEAFQFSNDDSILVTATEDGQFTGVNVPNRSGLWELKMDRSSLSQGMGRAVIEFSKTNRELLLGIGSVTRVVNAQTANIIFQSQHDYSPAVILPAYGFTEDKVLQLRLDDVLMTMDPATDSVVESWGRSYRIKSGLETRTENRRVARPISVIGNQQMIVTLNDTLRVYAGTSGKCIYETKANNFLISGNGKTLVYENGNRFYIYDLTAREPVCQFISMNSYDDGYVVLLNNGYYTGNRNCISDLGYIAKNKLSNVSQFDLKFNRPDKILSHLGKYYPDPSTTELEKAYYNAWQRRLHWLHLDSNLLNMDFTPPVCEVLNEQQIGNSQDSFRLLIKLSASDTQQPLQSLNVLANGVPVFGSRGIQINVPPATRFDTTLLIELTDGYNIIEPYVTNRTGLQSASIPFRVNTDKPIAHVFDEYSDSLGWRPLDIKIVRMSTTYFIGIGIDQFSDGQHSLQYSVKDIRDLAAGMKAKYGKNFVADTIFNEQLTIERVRQVKQLLKKTSINDKVIIAYSGHGVLSDSLDYYLSTYDMNFKKPEEKGLAYTELENLLDSIPARKKLLLIDACHSGEVDKEALRAMNRKADSLRLKRGTKGGETESTGSGQVGLSNSFELMRELFINLSNNTGAVIISAAAGNQYALEGVDNVPNGVFTYAILQALKFDEPVKVSELKRYVGKKVVKITNGLQKPTSRNETTGLDWNIWGP